MLCHERHTLESVIWSCSYQSFLSSSSASFVGVQHGKIVNLQKLELRHSDQSSTNSYSLQQRVGFLFEDYDRFGMHVGLSWPKWRIMDPSGRTWWPEDLHFVLGCLSGIFISLRTCAVLEVLQTVLTFNAPKWILVFAPRNPSIAFLTSFQLTSGMVILSLTQRVTGICSGSDVDGFSNCGFCNSTLNGTLNRASLSTTARLKHKEKHNIGQYYLKYIVQQKHLMTKSAKQMNCINFWHIF